jgi:oligopeptide transport system ATP-binding protein
VADPAAREKKQSPSKGEVPGPFNLPAGCVFESRCPHARNLFRDDPPSLTQIAEDEFVLWHFPLHE